MDSWGGVSPYSSEAQPTAVSDIQRNEATVVLQHFCDAAVRKDKKTHIETKQMAAPNITGMEPSRTKGRHTVRKCEPISAKYTTSTKTMSHQMV
mmetsp:Transcript_30979/g.72274  ORF Transcript_30979/g.72274 Transcript_30979/m.72274 type:complete len:94 (+) Transcript_30979:40-321(+)